MFKALQYLQKYKGHGQKGQVLSLVLMLFLLGSCLCVIMLQSSVSGMLTSRVYENKSAELYAADAGIEDARWIIKYDYLDTFLTNPQYKYYNYTSDWIYHVPELVNGENVTITIENVWIPYDVPVPSTAQAKTIIEAEKLIITSANTTSGYTISVTYFPEALEELKVESIGIWLPRGFDYVKGSCILDDIADNVTVKHAGNKAVIWKFSPSLSYDDLPGVESEVSPKIAEITFELDSELPDSDPDTVAWISTSGVADIPFSWESDVKVYKATSVAGTTEIEAWMAKSETRLLSGGIAGDYVAIGNSLMIDSDLDGQFRDFLFSESSTNLTSIPIDATVRAAYLYWTGWRNGVIFTDACDNFSNWIQGNSWSTAGAPNSEFRAYYDGGAASEREITLNTSVNLSGKVAGEVKVMWDQRTSGSLESGDRLLYAFSGNGSSGPWSSYIPAVTGGTLLITPYSDDILQDYLTENFSIRFKIEGFDTDDWWDGKEYCYLDNITITTSDMIPDTSVEFTIGENQVYFTGGGIPAIGTEKITADWSESMENDVLGVPEGYSYVCFKDVTALVKAFSAKAPDPAINHPGNDLYTVGDVYADVLSISQRPNKPSHLAHAGWSLIVIYTSADTKGHSLYLYDTFMHTKKQTYLDFDSDNISGGKITRFLVPEQIDGEVNAAKMTLFVGEGDEWVPGDFLEFNDTKLWDGTNSDGNDESGPSGPNNCWNGVSMGMSAEGVDIDTFYVTWASGLLQTGDTTANVNIYTDYDEYNLIYIILAFRDETRTGGSLSYLINQ